MSRRARWVPTAFQMAMGIVALGMLSPLSAPWQMKAGDVGVVGLGALLLLSALRWYRQSRREWVTSFRSRAGRCAACGYDLHESVTGCTECGARLPGGHRPMSETVAALERM